MPGQPGDTALIISIPIASKVVGSWRQQYDASAREGVGAHVTVLYPFLPVNKIGRARSAIEEVVAAASPFDVRFDRVEQFPGVTWLAPDPDEPFRELTNAFADAFPDHRPYGGQFDDVVPHLTVIDLTHDLELFKDKHEEFVAHSAGRLGFKMTVSSVHLIARGQERWTALEVFDLGSEPRRSDRPRGSVGPRL